MLVIASVERIFLVVVVASFECSSTPDAAPVFSIAARQAHKQSTNQPSKNQSKSEGGTTNKQNKQTNWFEAKRQLAWDTLAIKRKDFVGRCWTNQIARESCVRHASQVTSSALRRGVSHARNDSTSRGRCTSSSRSIDQSSDQCANAPTRQRAHVPLRELQQQRKHSSRSATQASSIHTHLPRLLSFSCSTSLCVLALLQ